MIEEAIKELPVELVEIQEPALAAELSRATREKSDEVSKETAKTLIERLSKVKKLWVVTTSEPPRFSRITSS